MANETRFTVDGAFVEETTDAQHFTVGGQFIEEEVAAAPTSTYFLRGIMEHKFIPPLNQPGGF